MLKNKMNWQVVSIHKLKPNPIYEQFGNRYHFNESEREILRLSLLFGYEDSQIEEIMQIQPDALDNHYTCMFGKTRTNSTRELHALFLRYVIQKLPT